MDKQPHFYIQAIEEQACRVPGESQQPSVLTMGRYVREEVPVGTDRTLGHKFWGIAKKVFFPQSGASGESSLSWPAFDRFRIRTDED